MFINEKDNYNIPTYYLGTAESQRGIELLNSLNTYKAGLKNQLQKLLFTNNDVLENLGDFGIKTELKSEITGGYDMKWNEGMFNQQVVVGTLSLLSSLQNEVLNAEFKCLKTISLKDNKME
jgi:GldM N-terminal domain